MFEKGNTPDLLYIIGSTPKGEPTTRSRCVLLGWGVGDGETRGGICKFPQGVYTTLTDLVSLAVGGIESEEKDRAGRG